MNPMVKLQQDCRSNNPLSSRGCIDARDWLVVAESLKMRR